MPDDRDPSEERLDLHLALPHTPFSRAVDGFLERLGRAVSWIWFALLVAIVANVTLRYVFGWRQTRLLSCAARSSSCARGAGAVDTAQHAVAGREGGEVDGQGRLGRGIEGALDQLAEDGSSNGAHRAARWSPLRPGHPP